MDSRVANDHTGGEPMEPPISVAHLMRTLRGYLPIIGLTLLAVTILYALVAVTVMLIKPSQPVTTVRFRLNEPATVTCGLAPRPRGSARSRGSSPSPPACSWALGWH